ncbi:ABC transporter ATP-binding protein [Pseudohongiella acticola]|jgi:glycerol transport system ATP-binding protein|uniref:ABC transporter ATP-binding protein n=1 Tax=Pseudohongiella acticola TaxID=1524254 RepID=UPI0030EC25D2
MAKITLNNIAHSYDGGNSYALKALTHEWHDGGAYALLGPSGCGKTTLLNIISGLLQPSEGQLLFDDTDVGTLPTERRNIAQVFQFPVLYDTMTVAENLAFPLRNRRGADKLSAADINARVQQAIAMLGLESLANRKARGLSADDKQKISLGRGLVRTDVNAILFDEPLTVIDPHLKWQLRTQLKQIHRQFGHTMIYVTHDQTEALTFADKVVVMLAGEVVQMGTPQELFDTPQHTFVGQFIGSPGMNVLPCEVAGNEAVIDGRRIALARQYPDLSGVVELGIRPEFVRLADNGHGMPVQIVGVEDVGRYRIARAQLQHHRLDIIVPEHQPIPSDPCVVFDSEHINIYQNSQLVSGASI